MKPPAVVPTVRMKLWHGVLLAATATAMVFAMAGCNGGSDNTSFVPASMWQQQGATYKGAVACRDCHANIYDEYTVEQAMGNPSSSTPDARHTGTNCSACHVTGFGEATGGKLDGSTPHLTGIGCESCHGPGSQHIAADSKVDRKKTITRVPPDKTCLACHSDRLSTPDGYRPGAIDQPFKPVTAANLRDTAPSSVRGPHYAPGAFLFGRGGYAHTAPMASPHASLPNTCLDCHQPGISTTTGKVKHGADTWAPNTDTTRPNCISCHSGTRSSGQLVQLGVTKMLIELGGEDPANPGKPDPNNAGGLLGAYKTANNIATSTNTDPDNPKVIAYKGAQYNYRFVRGEGSLGVHNPALAKRLLEEAKALLQ